MLMKFRIFKLLLVIAFGIFAIKAFSASFYYLTIDVENVLVKKRKMYIGIYNSEQNFNKNKYYKGKMINVEGKNLRIRFKLPKGVYSVQMFQDVNNDNTMNSLFGVPLEPYGVSCNVSGFPSFKKTRFMLNKNMSIKIKLKN